MMLPQFFPKHKNWDLSNPRQRQAKNIQIIADSESGDTANTSLIIYDNGEGQHPEDFEDTFLSLLRGNKNEIHFVQGKYNMGGTGGIVFCGKKRYQLIASKKHDGTGKFGFTLVRSHPFTQAEEKAKKNTWYEYLRIDGKIPAFEIDTLDLGLYKRNFKTGTVIKLYSYDTKGNRHLARDMNRSINEFLYEPALPLYTVEKAERYPNDKNLERELFGLKRRLEARKNEYLEKDGWFSQNIIDKRMGEVNVTIYVFKARVKGKTVKESIRTIQDEFFKNNMAVLFSLNGQVHGHYTSEFITRSLKFSLLKNHLLIHVDCTKMNYDFRKELFMASRDRLKDGEEAKHLRSVLAQKLKSGKLKEIHKRRKDAISIDTTESDELLRSFVDKLPLDESLQKLLDQLFQLNKKGNKLSAPTKPKKSSTSQQQEKPLFNPQRYPTFFKARLNEENGKLYTTVPLYGEKTVTFLSDVENEYFDRVEDPGELKMALLGYSPNETTGGDKKGNIKEIKDVLEVERRSPDDGAIRMVLKPTDEVAVDDEIQVRADLTAPDQNYSVAFWVKITEPPPPPKKTKKEDEPVKPGLPLLRLVYENATEDEPDRITWEKFEEGAGVPMDHDTVVYPYVDEEKGLLKEIYLNMDSKVLKDHKSKTKSLSPEQNDLINNKYIATIYAHTIFLYAINKEKKYEINNGNLTLAEYISDLFASHYAAFLLSFETDNLVDMLSP